MRVFRTCSAFVVATALAFAQAGDAPFIEVQKLVSGQPNSGGAFGYACALDGELAVVGAPVYGNPSTGRAFVFDLLSAQTTPRWSLLPAGVVEGDFFGGAVALEGGVLAISAMNRGVPFNAGAVWVYERVGDAWNEAALLVSSEPRLGGQFGKSLALLGDTLLVGARGEDGHSTMSGAAYVFRRTGGQWLEEARLIPSDAGVDAKFGWSVALGEDRAVVGALDAYPFGVRTGAVYEFVRTGTTWVEVARFNDPLAGKGEHFGYSVALDGQRLAVGACSDLGSGTFTGRAYVWHRATAGWVLEARLRVRDNVTGDYFANSIGLRGARLAVTSRVHAEKGPVSGAAYIFYYDGAEWGRQTLLTPLDLVTGDNYGASLALDGERVIVCAPSADLPFNSYGAAYVYRWQ